MNDRARRHQNCSLVAFFLKLRTETILKAVANTGVESELPEAHRCTQRLGMALCNGSRYSTDFRMQRCDGQIKIYYICRQY